ncbi:hypothetical protein F6450_14260 [Photobacterium damselae subsp. damselae]|uniref:Uncharacterized protein n=1 Tax=Photobacterium damselae subsp. damselae TaxID=85581 RepID=A0AAD3WU82_PHODD|nr:hypothetical protein F6450_14260 [Photobacterium damselae subsp. damselae]
MLELLWSVSFSKSVELHDKAIGHYLNTNIISKLKSQPDSVLRESYRQPMPSVLCCLIIYNISDSCEIINF